MKKILYTFTTFLFLKITAFAADAPIINCAWLPWCSDSSLTNPTQPNISNNSTQVFLVDIISNFIDIILVLSVFAIIFSGILYILSWGEEEKANKAKKWIIWSLAWVFLSISSWWIINFINNSTIS